MIHLTHKELLELRFWCEEFKKDGYAEERAKLEQYVSVFGLDTCKFDRVVEIGVGPYWGLLPYIRANIKVGVDSILAVYDAAGIREDRNGILEVSEPFEHWETNDRFDAIITTNALDHGEMGFHLIPKIWCLLNPGGRFYCHVHLRPADMLNLVHDHSLTEEQLDQHLSYTNLRQVRRQIFENDVDGNFCKTLVGIWEKP